MELVVYMCFQIITLHRSIIIGFYLHIKPGSPACQPLPFSEMSERVRERERERERKRERERESERERAAVRRPHGEDRGALVQSQLERLCHVIQVIYRKPWFRFHVLEWRLWSPDAAEPVLWNVGAVGVDGLVSAEVH